jgi:predicted nucleic acid-binding Zn ribbon protein
MSSTPPPASDPTEESPATADWDPDGVELARALVGRARGAPPASRARPWRRRASPGAGWSGPNVDERDPQRLDTAVERLVGEHGWGQDLAVHGVVARWDEVVGAEIAAHVQPERYADGEVTVRADSTAWATQVKLLAPNLVRRLNEEIGAGTVTRVNVLGPHAPSWRKGRRSVPGRGPRDTYG